MAAGSIELGTRELHIGPEHAGMLVGWTNAFTNGPYDHGAVLTFAQVGKDGAHLSLTDPDGDPRDTGDIDEGFANAVTLVALEKLNGKHPFVNLYCLQSNHTENERRRSTDGKFGVAALVSQTSHYGYADQLIPVNGRGNWGFGIRAIVNGFHRQLNAVRVSTAMRNRLYYAAAYHADEKALLVASPMHAQTVHELGQATIIHNVLLGAAATSSAVARAVEGDVRTWPDDIMRRFRRSRESLLESNLTVLEQAAVSSLEDSYVFGGPKRHLARHRLESLVLRSGGRFDLSNLKSAERDASRALHRREGYVREKIIEDADVFAGRVKDSAYTLERLGRLARMEVELSA